LNLKSKNCKAKCDNVDIKTSVKKPSKTKSATKAPSKGVTSDSAKLPNICDNIVYDSYRFGPLVDNAGKTVSKFGPVIKIAENIPEECKSQLSIAASFPSYKARLEFEGFASVYGLENWKNYRYTVGPKNKPIFSNMDSDAVVALLNAKYLDGKLNNVQVYQLSGKGVVKDSNKGATLSVVPEYKISRLDDSTLTKKEENKALLAKDIYVSKDTYTFDIDGDLLPNVLSIVSQDGKFYVRSEEGGKLESMLEIDAARYKVLQNARFVEGSPSEAKNGYLMTFGKQGEDVVRFMVDTNKYATDIAQSRDKYIFQTQTKFANLQSLADFIDNVANMNQRAHYMSSEVLKEQKGNLVVQGDDKVLKAYANTFGEDVPSELLALYFGLGSAIYTTVNSDYLPTKRASQGLVIARGAQDSENWALLKTGKSQNNLTNFAVSAYKDTVKMYKDQLDASKIKVERLNF